MSTHPHYGEHWGEPTRRPLGKPMSDAEIRAEVAAQQAEQDGLLARLDREIADLEASYGPAALIPCPHHDRLIGEACGEHPWDHWRKPCRARVEAASRNRLSVVDGSRARVTRKAA